MLPETTKKVTWVQMSSIRGTRLNCLDASKVPGNKPLKGTLHGTIFTSKVFTQSSKIRLTSVPLSIRARNSTPSQ